MPDLRFYEFLGPLTSGEAARLCGGRLADGAHADSEIHTLAPLDAIEPGACVFAESARALRDMDVSAAALVLADEETAKAASVTGSFCLVANPRAAFCAVADRLFRSRRLSPVATAPLVDPAASIGANVVISAGATIGPDAVIGDNSVIEAHAVIGPGVTIGAESYIGVGAVISHAEAADRLYLAAGAVIGQAGFGFAQSGSGALRMPQLGRVLLGAGVEIGANSTVDRGALGDTVLGDGVKIDNLVQVGHNVRIGDHCILVAQAGVSGSCVIEAGAVLGGQAGIADHVRIGPGARIAAKAGILNDVGAGEKWAGYPAQPAGAFFRQIAVLKKLAREKRSGK